MGIAGLLSAAGIHNPGISLGLLELESVDSRTVSFHEKVAGGSGFLIEPCLPMG